LIPTEDAAKKKVMEYVDMFYESYDSLAAFTFKAPSKRRPPPLTKPRKRIDGKMKLERLGEDPEFKEAADSKKQTQAENKKNRLDTPVEGHIEKIQAMLDKMEKDLTSGEDFLIDKEYTLADVIATVFCGRVYLKSEEDMFGPHLKKYWARIQRRDSFKKAPVICRMEDTKYWQKHI